MSEETVQPVEQQPTEEQILQMFLAEYSELCKKWGLQLKATPVVSLDENKFGTYGMDIAIQYRVIPMPRK